MPEWSETDVALFDAARSLHLAAGDEERSGVEVGMVVVGRELFVRAFRGPGSAWFRAAVGAGHGRITVDGLTRDVTLSAYAGSAAPIDAAYRGKYGGDAALVTNRAAREATLRISG